MAKLHSKLLSDNSNRGIKIRSIKNRNNFIGKNGCLEIIDLVDNNLDAIIISKSKILVDNYFIVNSLILRDSYSGFTKPLNGRIFLIE